MPQVNLEGLAKLLLPIRVLKIPSRQRSTADNCGSQSWFFRELEGAATGPRFHAHPFPQVQPD